MGSKPEFEADKFVRNTFLISIGTSIVSTVLFKTILPSTDEHPLPIGLCIVLGILIGFIVFCWRMAVLTNRPNKLRKKIERKNRKRGSLVSFPVEVKNGAINVNSAVVTLFNDHIEMEDINTNNVCSLENNQVVDVSTSSKTTVKTQSSGLRVGVSVRVAKGIRVGASEPVKSKIYLTKHTLTITYFPTGTTRKTLIQLGYGKKKSAVKKFVRYFNNQSTSNLEQKPTEMHL